MDPSQSQIRQVLGSIADPIALLERLFEHAPVAMQVYSADGRSLMVNRAFRELFGAVPPPEYNVLSDDILERQGLLGLFRRAFRDGETTQVPPLWYDPRELRRVHVLEGRRVGLEVTLLPLRGHAGDVEHVALCFKDITGELRRQQITETLRQREEELEATLASIGDAVIATDADGRITRMNPIGCQLTGWREAEARGLSLDQVFRIIDEESRAPVENPVAQVARERSAIPLPSQTVLVARDGTERGIAACGAPIRDPEHRIFGVVVVFRDQTEERKAKRALSESEARKAAVIGGALDCIITMDQQGMVTEFNPAAEKTFGYSRSEAAGKPFGELILPPRLRDAYRAALAKYLATGEAPPMGRPVEVTGMRADGTEFPMEVIATRTAPDGPAAFTGFIRDLTERKTAEAAIERLREEREANLKASIQARDEFLAAAGHELKTPLAALLLQIQGLQRAKREDPAKTASRLEKAAKSGRRLEWLINRLLDVSRITAGKLRLEPESLDLADLVRDVLGRFAEGDGKNRSPIILRCDEQVFGRWDRLRIDQIVTNLVSNAVKYGLGRPIEVELRIEDEQAVLRVTDHGIGIDPDHQAKLFQRFERGAATREFGGLGLGLWISRQIAEASGGTIEVQSTPGQGSTFTVRLPIGRHAEMHHGDRRA